MTSLGSDVIDSENPFFCYNATHVVLSLCNQTLINLDKDANSPELIVRVAKKCRAASLMQVSLPLAHRALADKGHQNSTGDADFSSPAESDHRYTGNSKL